LVICAVIVLPCATVDEKAVEAKPLASVTSDDVNVFPIPETESETWAPGIPPPNWFLAKMRIADWPPIAIAAGHASTSER
jgi:hypothetical protein